MGYGTQKKYRLQSVDQRLPRKRGQTFVEYTLLFTIIASLMIAMTPMLRRSIQGVVKLVADQVGVQKNADQQGGQAGYLVSQYATTRVNQNDKTSQRLGIITYNYLKDSTATQTQVTTNEGYTPSY